MMTFYLGADDDDRLARADERAEREDEIAARRADEAKERCNHIYESVRVCTGCGEALS